MIIREGAVPKDLNGTFLKNGPNQRYEDSDTMRSHWFAGDGMLHAICLSNSELFYCNRFSRTGKYNLESKIGKLALHNFQDLAEIGVLLAPIHDVLVNLGYYPEYFEEH